MSDQHSPDAKDGINDAIAAAAIITIIVITLTFWLSGMPS
ncbi:MAG: methionine synthase [Spongiibacteraceae bacterium]